MVSRYSNELNSFRSGIEDRVNQHRDKVDAVNRALGIKADKVFENAKKLSDAGGKLMESGIGGSVGSTALASFARKGITSFNKFRAGASKAVEKGFGETDVDKVAARMKNEVFSRQSQQNAQSARDNAPSEETSEGGANQSVGGETKEGTSNLGESESTSQPTEMSEMQQVGGRSGVQVDDNSMGLRGNNQRFTEETMQEGAERRGMAQEDTDATEPPGQAKPNTTSIDDETKLNVDDGEETKGGDSASGDADEAGDATGDAVEAGETGGEIAGDVGVEAGAEAAAGGLEEAAAATSWLAWLGIPEILGAAGAISGAVGAGIGIADAVKGGNQETKAEGMPTTAPQTGIGVAGTYVVPTQDSLS